jgi:hypothetical protein
MTSVDSTAMVAIDVTARFSKAVRRAAQNPYTPLRQLEVQNVCFSRCKSDVKRSPRAQPGLTAAAAHLTSCARFVSGDDRQLARCERERPYCH